MHDIMLISSATQKMLLQKMLTVNIKFPFYPYSNGLLVNDTSTKLNFSVMENNTDVPKLFTSLVINGQKGG